MLCLILTVYSFSEHTVIISHFVFFVCWREISSDNLRRLSLETNRERRCFVLCCSVGSDVMRSVQPSLVSSRVRFYANIIILCSLFVQIDCVEKCLNLRVYSQFSPRIFTTLISENIRVFSHKCTTFIPGNVSVFFL